MKWGKKKDKQQNKQTIVSERTETVYIDENNAYLLADYTYSHTDKNGIPVFVKNKK